jgi:hypothetical protein
MPGRGKIRLKTQSNANKRTSYTIRRIMERSGKHQAMRTTVPGAMSVDKDGTLGTLICTKALAAQAARRISIRI